LTRTEVPGNARRASSGWQVQKGHWGSSARHQHFAQCNRFVTPTQVAPMLAAEAKWDVIGVLRSGASERDARGLGVQQRTCVWARRGWEIGGVTLLFQRGVAAAAMNVLRGN